LAARHAISLLLSVPVVPHLSPWRFGGTHVSRFDDFLLLLGLLRMYRSPSSPMRFWLAKFRHFFVSSLCYEDGLATNPQSHRYPAHHHVIDERQQFGWKFVFCWPIGRFDLSSENRKSQSPYRSRFRNECGKVLLRSLRTFLALYQGFQCTLPLEEGGYRWVA
jgi:hypothetical protein